jgi:subtilisin family serine protease
VGRLLWFGGQRMRKLLVGLVAGALTLTAAPARAAVTEVSLVVGLRQDDAPVAALGRLRAEPVGGAIAVDVPVDDVAAATRRLTADPNVAYVEPDHVARAMANDPAYPAQWGITRSRVDQAWATTHGSARVTVAVVDTGVGRLPDLAGRVLPGHDFVNDDDDATDDNGHGTMAAGVIAAAGNNRTGIAGICWSCRILPVKVLDAKGAGSYTDIARGIRYAADRHATIISLSLGGTDDGQVLRDAVAYAVGRGSLVIAAAGNKGTSAPHYPAAIPAVLAVGAVTATGARYPWSNYGALVDLTAPGCNPAQGRDGVVAQFCGTSSATPFVAGVAALLASTSPAPSATVIRAALTSSPSHRVDAVGALRHLDTTAPAVRVFASSRFAPTVYLTARATDASGIARLDLLVNDHIVARYAGGLHRFAIRTAAYGKTITARIRVYDRAGNGRLSPVRLWRR